MYIVWLVLAVFVYLTLRNIDFIFLCLFTVWMILSLFLACRLDKKEYETSKNKKS